MDSGPLTELSRKILADLLRTSLTNTLASNSRNGYGGTRRPKSTPAIGDDLPSYLRNVHRRLSTKEVAALLHCHTETIYRRIKLGGFPAHRDNGRWKFNPYQIAQRIEQQSFLLVEGRMRNGM